ncbi:MAG: hypothetical protein QGH59_10675 [Gemmatimonadota bacterium]|nr:hypothetical protein [Gemmatimonadota bacterium]
MIWRFHSSFRSPTALRVAALLLLIAGVACEAGHLEHHVGDVGHQPGSTDPEHHACCVLHGVDAVGDTPRFTDELVVLGRARVASPERLPEFDGPRLPDSRAPPTAS